MNSASLCTLAGRYDKPIPPWYLAPIAFLKIPAQATVPLIRAAKPFYFYNSYFIGVNSACQLLQPDMTQKFKSLPNEVTLSKFFNALIDAFLPFFIWMSLNL
jgi:hypothetical protein